MSKKVAYRNMAAMGTRLEIVFVEVTDDQADAVFGLISKEVNRIEGILSNHDPNALFSVINHGERRKTWKIGKEVAGWLQTLINFNRLTGGYFDFSLGDFHSPRWTEEERAEYLHIPLDDRMYFDPVDLSISLLHPITSLDSGSFGKGLALDLVKKILLKAGIKDTFISFGGSSVFGLGNHTAAPYWPAGIMDFRDEKSVIYTFMLKDQALSSSGNSLNNRKKFPEGHIIHPLTGERKGHLELVSVKGESAMTAEILSTALFAAGRKNYASIMKNFPNCDAVTFSLDEKNETIHISEFKHE